MTMNPKPGNEPDSSDMSIEHDLDAEVRKPADPNLAEEEEAAKLGDFA
ncbi:hypothetical protein [Sphingomonas psychrotolerans]|nr:hypothetical protein [Sphingomonas psychrotolerans]